VEALIVNANLPLLSSPRHTPSALCSHTVHKFRPSVTKRANTDLGRLHGSGAFLVQNKKKAGSDPGLFAFVK